MPERPGPFPAMTAPCPACRVLIERRAGRCQSCGFPLQVPEAHLLRVNWERSARLSVQRDELGCARRHLDEELGRIDAELQCLVSDKAWILQTVYARDLATSSGQRGRLQPSPPYTTSRGSNCRRTEPAPSRLPRRPPPSSPLAPP